MEQITRYIDVNLMQSARITLLRLHAKKFSYSNCHDSLILDVKIANEINRFD